MPGLAGDEEKEAGAARIRHHVLRSARRGGTPDRHPVNGVLEPGAAGHGGVGRDRARVGDRCLDGLGDPVGAGPGVLPVRRGAGGGLQAGDQPAVARRLPAQHRRRHRPRRGVLVLFLRGGRPGTSAVPQGCALHRGDGLRDRLHQPGGGTGDHPRAADGLAVHPGRVRRRPGDDPAGGAAVPAVPRPADRRGRQTAGRPGCGRDDGRARRDGHVRPAAGFDLEAAGQPGRVHRHQPPVRHGLGRRVARHRRRPAHRRGLRRLGARLASEGLLPRRPPAGRGAVGSADRPPGRGDQLRLFDRERAPGRGAVERGHQLRRGGLLRLRRPDHHSDPADLPEVLRHRHGRADLRVLLPRDGRGRLRDRTRLPPAGSDPGHTLRHGHRRRGQLELHHLAQHRLPRLRRRAGGPLRAYRGCSDAADDGRRPRPDHARPVSADRLLVTTDERGHVSYLLDNRARAAGRRFEAIAELFDASTLRHLDGVGLTAGWRCWEVGAGGPSVVRALGERVGPGGRVLATDIDVSWVGAAAGPTVEVRRHDVAADAPPAEVFDLVHARLVLVHVADRDRALRRMVGALRPGGWLVVEDADPVLQPLSCPDVRGPEEELANAIRTGFRALLAERGADLAYGRKLPRLFREAGLVDVGADAYFPLALPACATLETATIEHVRETLVAAGIATAEQIDRHLDNVARDRLDLAQPPMISAWGRRPSAD
ncbi:methyltransferase domain-containing protein [Pseudonocardia sp. K10HN5]|uniref:Methyltransferase domain-containing protein n=1 Tax=Pseudonocardia acidicola TaxID=2724939 RepID=A0ABX1SB27_9PSEU|nr:methyltransferase domain-containing protein [Pseudonocardia acidicola]